MCKHNYIRQWWDKVVHRKCYTTTGSRKWSSQEGNNTRAVNRTYCNVSNGANHADSKERNSKEERNKSVRGTEKVHPLVERAKHTWLEWTWRRITMRLASLEDSFWCLRKIQHNKISCLTNWRTYCQDFLTIRTDCMLHRHWHLCLTIKSVDSRSASG